MNRLPLWVWLPTIFAALSMPDSVVAKHYYVDSVIGNDAHSGVERNRIISRKGTRWHNILGFSKAATLDPGALVFTNNFVILGGEDVEKVANQGAFVHENNTYFLLDGAKIGYPLTPGEIAHISK